MALWCSWQFSRSRKITKYLLRLLLLDSTFVTSLLAIGELFVSFVTRFKRFQFSDFKNCTIFLETFNGRESITKSL